MLAKKSTTARSHGWDSSRDPANTLISFKWAATNVVPSHATPRTHTHALMPDLNVAALSTLLQSILQKNAMAVAAASMKVMMAASLFNIGSLMRPTVLLIAVA